MRVRLVALVALVALASAGAVGFIAVLGIEVDATEQNLTADWLSSESATSINLRRDGTFASNGISRCIGDVGVFLDGSGTQTDLTVADGEGSWHVEPNDTGHDHVLVMDFRSPRQFRLRWQVNGVTWQFHPAEVALVSLNPAVAADGALGHCFLQA